MKLFSLKMNPSPLHRDRFKYTPSWKLTHLGFVRGYFFAKGGDEFHNLCIMLIIPLVGCFEWCYLRKMYPTNPEDEHLGGMREYFTFGKIVRGCRVCEEYLLEVVLQPDQDIRSDPVYCGPASYIVPRMLAYGEITEDPRDRSLEPDEYFT